MKKSGQESVQKDRGEWKAIISYQEGGTQKRLTKRTGVKCTPKKGDMRGKQKAEAILRDWRDELIAADAAASPVILSDAPLLEFCRRYAEAKRYLVKDSTYLGYLSETNRLSKTPLARMPIGDITAEDIQRHESSLAQRGLAGSSLKHHHSFLASVSKEDLSRLYAAFEQLSVLKKFSVPEMMEPGREVFQRDHDAYRERMAWINGFMMSKGYPEPIFRDLESFETSSDDYDYFYELKTPEQLAEEEALKKG